MSRAPVTDNVITVVTTPPVNSIIIMSQPKGGALTLWSVTYLHIPESLYWKGT